VNNKQDHIARLQTAIHRLHNCAAVWRGSLPVHDTFQGKTVWKVEVECFELSGHSKAKKCYAWSQEEPEKIMTMLELPPVISADGAIKVGVRYQIKTARANQEGEGRLESDFN
jgi:hypothetical protein